MGNRVTSMAIHAALSGGQLGEWLRQLDNHQLRMLVLTAARYDAGGLVSAVNLSTDLAEQEHTASNWYSLPPFPVVPVIPAPPAPASAAGTIRQPG